MSSEAVASSDVVADGPNTDVEDVLIAAEGQDAPRRSCGITAFVILSVMAALLAVVAVVGAAGSTFFASRGAAMANHRDLESSGQADEELPDCLGKPSPMQQLQGELLRSICSHAGKGQNLLVFGAGYDSEFWMDSNPHGITHFIEDNDRWITFQSDRVKAEVTMVAYSSNKSTALHDVEDEEMLGETYGQLPKQVTEKGWDLIVIDGPDDADGGPGRGQAIYTATKLASQEAYIYVDDCEREVEDAYMKQYLVKQGWEMAVHDLDGHGGNACVLWQPWAQENVNHDGPPACLGTPNSQQQLNGEVLKAVCSHFGKDKSFLVFGTGYDSPFWVDSNPEGEVHFLEDHGEWIAFQPENVQRIVTTVKYTSSMKTALDQIKDEDMLREFHDTQLPSTLSSHKWDVILVDAPVGYVDANGVPTGPGRGQSIYAAHLLAKPTSYVYVDDCNRAVEDAYIQEYFVDRGWTKVVHESNGHGGATCVLFHNETADSSGTVAPVMSL